MLNLKNARVSQKISFLNDKNEIEYCLFHSFKNDYTINVLMIVDLQKKSIKKEIKISNVLFNR